MLKHNLRGSSQRSLQGDFHGGAGERDALRLQIAKVERPQHLARPALPAWSIRSRMDSTPAESASDCNSGRISTLDRPCGRSIGQAERASRRSIRSARPVCSAAGIGT